MTSPADKLDDGDPLPVISPAIVAEVIVVIAMLLFVAVMV